ncbi:hypothetical protein NUW58_g1143 [Xylaria curta]|uniref:Uncharacterized protein n=1 Tax=Xylaria curta TaxID=42375 RepID=A0ACC1PMR0_9PEZI|nr:hypothetical protein NUW58_g1143 [Xylaria curta]
MRLVNATKVVCDFKIEFETPLNDEHEDHEAENLSNSSDFKYAILSHTWGWRDEQTGKWAHKADEVTYSERHNFRDPFDQSLDPNKRRAYQKIYYTCRRALDLGCDYVWIDSCCIDKSNSAELTESINSMFRWYSEAHVCLVYLVDSCSQATAWEDYTLDPYRQLYDKDGSPCRWFSRCWTLQELMASRNLEFYDSEWSLIDTLRVKDSTNSDRFGCKISEITQVDAEAFLGEVPLWEYSIEAKMSWAARRRAGRPEDLAYSLLGLFDIHMPLIYGEGARAAFQRLQREIIKSTPDLSILAWHTEQSHPERQFCSALADSPSQFRFHRRICRLMPESHHTMTNKGIQMTSVLQQVQTTQGERYFLCLEDQGGSSQLVGIFLRKIGYDLFRRVDGRLAEIEVFMVHQSTHRATFYITISPQQENPEFPGPNDGSIHIPPFYPVCDVVPEASWDCESRTLLGSMPCHDGAKALRIELRSDGTSRTMTLGILFRSSSVLVFDCNDRPDISKKVFTRTNRRSLMNWSELWSMIPEIRSLSDRVISSCGIGLTVRVMAPDQRPSQLFIDYTGTATEQLNGATPSHEAGPDHVYSQTSIPNVPHLSEVARQISPQRSQQQVGSTRLLFTTGKRTVIAERGSGEREKRKTKTQNYTKMLFGA